MFLLQGPFPANPNSLVLPSPLETNTEGLRSTIQTIRMMDGRLKTYVKRKGGKKKFRWEFEVGHLKAKEVEDYFILYAGTLCQISWRGESYTGFATLNPFEMRGAVSEFYRLTIEFEEKT